MRPRAELVEVAVLEKRLGSLPVIADFCRRIDIAGIIDELCPIRDVALATHGQVIEVLIANRLTNPSAMAGIADWARAWAVPEVYGIAASALGDDRLGRALDAVAEHTDTIVGTVGAAAIDRFGIDVTRLHWVAAQTPCAKSRSSHVVPAGRAGSDPGRPGVGGLPALAAGPGPGGGAGRGH